MTTGDQTAAAERAVQGLTAVAAALVKPYDVVGTATRLLSVAADTAGAAAAGLIMRGLGDAQPELLAATSHRAEELEVYQVQNQDGPCFEAMGTGNRVAVSGADLVAHRWPAVADAFRRAGYVAVQAIPLRWHDEVIGALNLFWTAEWSGGPRMSELSGVFADMATLAIVHSGTVSAADVQRRTLAALDERTVIERAKGVLAQQRSLSMDAAYQALLDAAAERGQLVGSTALAVIEAAASTQKR